MKHFLKFETDEVGILQCERVEGINGKIPFKQIRDIIGNTVQYVYHVDLGDESIVLAIDEEGLLSGLNPTFWLYSEENMRVETYPLVGKILVVKLKGEDEIVCLSEEEIEMVKSKVMVDARNGRYYLPLNDEYIKRQNKFFKDLGFTVIKSDD